MQRPMENAFIDASERSRSSAVWNVRLRFLTSVVILVALGLQIGVACLSVNDYEIWSSPESFAFIGLSMIWNTAEFIVRFLRKKGIHPGAHVAIDLILWMGLFSSGLVQVLVNYYSALPIAAGTLKLVCSILHFVLFVYACIDCDRLRKRGQLDLVAKAVSTLKEGEEFELSSRGTLKEIAPGMALVSIETLAKLQNSVCVKCGETKV